MKNSPSSAAGPSRSSAVNRTLWTFGLSVAICLAMWCQVFTSRAHDGPATSGASLVSDKADYLPGSTAFLTGSRFQPNEKVAVVVMHYEGDTNHVVLPDGQDHETWTVVADSNGAFVTTWHVCEDDCLGATLEATAVGLSSGLSASVVFTDGFNENIEGWLNLTSKWGTSANGANSAWNDADVVPLRFSANLTPGTYTVIFRYDFADPSTGVHCYDSLASYDQTTEPDPTLGITGLTPTGLVTIPVDTSLPAGAQILGALMCYNIASASVGPYSLAGQKKSLSMTFTVTGAAGVAKNVVIAYGAKLASATVWGSGKGVGNFPGGSGKAYIVLGTGPEKNFSLNANVVAPAPKIDQTITFGSIPNKTYGDPNFTISASASSGLLVNFAVISGPATVSTSTLSGGQSVATVSLTGAGTVTIQASQPGNDVYNPAPNVSQSFAVNKTSADVTLSNLIQTYDGTAKSATATTSPSGLNVVITYNGSIFPPINAGSYTVVATASDPNYIGSTTGTLVINKASSTVNVTAGSFTYDGAAKTGSAVVTGAGGLNQALPVAYSSGSAPVNAGSYTVSATFAGDANHDGSTGSATLTIAPKAASVTANNKSKIYGEANPSLDATVTGTAGSDTLNYTLATSATPSSDVGSYPITVTLGANPNYTVSTTAGTLSVTAKTASIVANDKSRIYGDANPALDATVIGTVGTDSLNYTLAASATSASGVGSYPITVTLGSNPNYNVTTTDGTLSITPKAASITANDKSKTYGAANPALDAAVLGIVGIDTLNFTLATTATESSSVGSYPIAVTLGSNPNYAVTTVDATLMIMPKSVAIVANDMTKTYGDANPALDATVIGTVGTDSLNHTLATSATSASGVGSYPIIVTLGSNPNYAVTTSDGTLTITPKTASITANDKSKTYGDENPALDATVTGIVGTDTLNFTLATAATSSSGAGNYPITVTLGSNPNYSITTTGGTLSITPKAASITANDQTKTYGSANPALDAVVTGTIGTDTLSYSLTTTATSSSGVGSYPITVTLGSNPNYSITTTGGALTVTAKAASVAANSKSKIYGTANPALDAIVTGAVGTETLSFTLATPATASSGVGSYPIIVTLDANPNYTVTTTDSLLTITPRPITVTANAQSKYFGQVDPALTYTVAGTLAAGDSFTGALTRNPGEVVGSYAINQGSLALSANYDLTYVGALLTINLRPTTITYTGAVTAQFGDCVAASAKLIDTLSGLPLASQPIVLAIHGNPTQAATVTGADGTAGGLVQLSLAPTSLPATVQATANFAGSPTHQSSSTSQAFALKPQLVAPPEGASAVYTGEIVYWTTSTTSSTATLALSATVADKSNSCYADITKAKVTFSVANSPTGPWTPLTGASNLPVGPITPGNVRVGTASATIQYNIGNNNAITLYLRIEVNGDYTMAPELHTVSISKPVPGQITGAGTLNNNTVVGMLPGLAAGTGSSQTAVAVSYNKSGSNPQGSISVVVDTGTKRYLLKSNAISTFAVTSNASSFAAKCSIIDYDTGANIDGGALMQVAITDSTAGDTLAVSVQNTKTGGLWFGSNWDKVTGKVLQTSLTGGNLSVR